jgi:Tfp pilus assembly protein PilN
MKNSINLLPMSYRRQQIIRVRAYQWSVGICAVLAIGWIFHWYELREQQAMVQRMEVLKREHQPTQMMLNQLVEMRKKLVNLEEQERIARELEHQRNALTLLGVVSQTAQKTNGRLRITDLELTDFQRQPKTDAAGSPMEQTGGLRLAGVSLDNPAVAELVVGLEQSGIFRRVELNTLNERPEADTSLRHYEIRCEF